MMEVRIKRLHPEARIPEYKSAEAAGADLYACLDEEVIIAPYGISLISAGFAIEIPHGYQGEIRARSGLSLKEGLFVLNGPGTIDSDYRGEVKIILANFTNEPKKIHHQDRIAQLLIMPVIHVQFSETELSETARRQNGFGSTGKK
jgi:dUTP pyrophosphatase